jgi:signal transduction histidine kinase
MALKRLASAQTDTGVPSTEFSKGIRPEILVVDDEENVLKALRRILSDEYVVHTASSGKEALDAMRNNPNISLIISDQRMPVMSGTEFLNQSIHIKPDAIRIILTGYTDVKDLIDSINSGRVFQYLTKPFEPDDLKIIVRRGLDYYAKNKELERALRELQDAYDNLKNAQDQLIRSEKMSMLGKLMGSIAHEIRNPITNINNSTRLMAFEWDTIKDVLTRVDHWLKSKSPAEDFRKSFPKDLNIENAVHEFDAAMGIINHSCDLVTEVIEDLRGFSRLDDAEFILTDLNNQIDRALNLLKSKFKHQVEFVKEYGDVPRIMGLPGPIAQVMINMINNAAQAIRKEGRVCIRTMRDADHVIVEIKDNGVGIPKEHLDKIFEPGFTTKSEFDGTGLGLTISYDILKRHRGKIDVQSEEGKGSVFRLYFPIKQPETTAN